MKLYSYPDAPSPARVELFLKYKALEIETENVDLREGKQLQETYRRINPCCTVPALVLDDGTCLTEVIAICMYLDSKFPDKPVFGATDSERALIINWMHRIYLEGFQATAEVLRNSSPAMKDRALTGPGNVAQITELAERGKTRLPDYFKNLNERLDRRPFIVGNNLSQADIDAYVMVNFAEWVEIKPSAEHGNLFEWHKRVEALLQ